MTHSDGDGGTGPGRMNASPFQLMPQLTADEFTELWEDIRRHGVRVPVDVDEDGNILDGHHRARIAEEIGIDCPRRVLSGLTEEQKRGHALAVNVHRRQLNREQKRELIRASLKADPQLSDRQHAERTGSTHPTVAAVRSELEASGDVEKLSTRTDTSGRSQPTSRGEIPHARPQEQGDLTGEIPQLAPDSGLPANQDKADVVLDGIDRFAASKSVPQADDDGLAAQRGAAKAAVDAALDKHVPDPDGPRRKWQLAFLKAMGPASRLMAEFAVNQVAENADDECLAELSRITDDLVSYRESVRAAVPKPNNVRHLRAVS